MFLVVVLYSLAAASFTIAKAALNYVQPIFFVGFRMSVAGVLLLAYSIYKDSQSLCIKMRDAWYFILVILIHIYAAFVLDLMALQNMSSSKGAFLYTLSPFITAFFSYHYFTEKLTPKKVVGLLIGFVGFLPEFLSFAPAEGENIWWLSKSELMMLGSVVASVYGWILVRVLLKRDYSVYAINGIGMVGGGMLAFLTSAILEEWRIVPITSGKTFLGLAMIEGWRVSPVTSWMPFLGLTALIIIVSNVLLYNLYGHLLRKYTATFLSFAGFLSPLIAALFGWLFLHEAITVRFICSVATVAVGLTLFYYEELRQGYIVH